MARLVKIKGTATAEANDGLIADSNSKIPAVDASLITALSGTNVASGTIPIARIDTGTTANKIVQLDGSGKIPALDGSQLTNVSTSTKSSSNPTISTNPSGGVGSEWHNTSTGNMYICTDATAGANVWTNVGTGVDHIGTYKYQGETYGWRIGGGSGAMRINRYPFATQTNSTDVGALLSYGNLSCVGGAKSKTHGFKVGGDGGGTTPIDKFAFTTGSVSVTDHGDLVIGVYSGATAGNGDYIWKAGGYRYSPNGLLADIEKFATATDSNASKTGDLSNNQYLTSGNSSETHGYAAGGHTPGPGNGHGPATNQVHKWSFATDGNATDVLNLATTKGYTSSNSSTTHGYAHGGYPNINTIEKFPFASDSNATDVGDLVVAGDYCIGSSSTTHGYCSGNRNAPQNTIERYSFSVDGNSTDWADLDHSVGGGGSSAAS